jgi:hypothetical protein
VNLHWGLWARVDDWFRRCRRRFMLAGSTAYSHQ